MRVKQLLQLIPDGQLEMLGAESKVDYQVKKLTGKSVFQLILNTTTVVSAGKVLRGASGTRGNA